MTLRIIKRYIYKYANILIWVYIVLSHNLIYINNVRKRCLIYVRCFIHHDLGIVHDWSTFQSKFRGFERWARRIANSITIGCELGPSLHFTFLKRAYRLPDYAWRLRWEKPFVPLEPIATPVVESATKPHARRCASM